MMKSSMFWFIWKMWVLLYMSFFTIIESNDLELKLVQLLWRHGDRAPLTTYPADPWKDAWPDGLGQLTCLGKQQHYELGQYLKKRYGHLVNYTYNPEAIYIRSTDYDRTLMSAYSNLAGFFPPKGEQLWNKQINWQPIPVHTRPEKEDYLIGVYHECPQYSKLYAKELESEKAEKINAKYRDVITFLAQKSQLPLHSFIDSSELYDMLLVQKAHNMKWPKWATKKIFGDLEKFRDLFVQWFVKTQVLARLAGGGGLLVGEMTKNMETAIEKPNNKRKIYIYSAHDITIAALLSALGVFNDKAPPYASVVMVELWKGNGDFVKVLYRNDTNHEPYELTLKGCTTLCPFAQFKTLTAAVVPNDIRAECELHDLKRLFASKLPK